MSIKYCKQHYDVALCNWNKTNSLSGIWVNLITTLGKETSCCRRILRGWLRYMGTVLFTKMSHQKRHHIWPSYMFKGICMLDFQSSILILLPQTNAGIQTTWKSSLATPHARYWLSKSQLKRKRRAEFLRIAYESQWGFIRVKGRTRARVYTTTVSIKNLIKFKCFESEREPIRVRES